MTVMQFGAIVAVAAGVMLRWSTVPTLYL